MLKTFRRVSSNKGKKLWEYEKKNRVFAKFGRIVEENVLNNILKVSADRRWAEGRGGAFERGFLQFFLNNLKTMQIRRKNPSTILNCVKLPIKILLTFFIYSNLENKDGQNLFAYHVLQSPLTCFEDMRCSVLLNIPKW